MTAPDHILAAGPVALNTQERCITINAGEPVRLTHSEATILAALMRHAGEIMSKDRLAMCLYGDDAWDRCEKIIDVFICKIRKKLRQAGATHLIETSWDFGYRFVREPNCVTRSFTPAIWERIRAVAEQEGILL